MHTHALIRGHTLEIHLNVCIVLIALRLVAKPTLLMPSHTSHTSPYHPYLPYLPPNLPFTSLSPLPPRRAAAWLPCSLRASKTAGTQSPPSSTSPAPCCSYTEKQTRSSLPPTLSPFLCARGAWIRGWCCVGGGIVAFASRATRCFRLRSSWRMSGGGVTLGAWAWVVVWAGLGAWAVWEGQ